MATLAMQSNEKNNILGQLKDRLTNLDLDSNQKSKLRGIQKIIEQSVNDESSWDSFLHKFEAIYPQFFERLKV